MVHIYPFSAVRPKAGKAQDIADVPYDVVNADEAREIVADRPDSFLNISRTDAFMKDISPYDDRVYQESRKVFDRYIADGLFVQDDKPYLYVYHVIDGGRTYTGIACCADVREYESGAIHRHELTRYDKEEDRTKHIDVINANTGPVVFLHRKDEVVASLLAKVIVRDPDMSVTAANGSIHKIFTIRSDEIATALVSEFSKIQGLYIADGHHRCKSALNVVNRRNEKGISVPEETYHVMGVVFAEDEVKVHGYSRLLTTTDRTTDEFLEAVKRYATVTPYTLSDPLIYTLVPDNKEPGHVFHLYMKGVWHECFIPSEKSGSLIDELDVSVLQEKILVPLLNITDSRGDQRLQYLGGARPVKDLMARVDSGEFAAAIAMQPVRVDEVFDIADQGGIMPPKSTWFEPKLLSGLLVHKLE